LSLVYPDFRLHGVERPVEYNVDPPNNNPLIEYLVAIGEQSLSPQQIASLNKLVSDPEQAFDFLTEPSMQIRPSDR
jgi:hypothetical protein